MFIWLAGDPTRVSPSLMQVLAESDTSHYMSHASAWELAIKKSIGKLQIPADVQEYVQSRAEQFRISLLPIRLEHVCRVATLPMHHGDPFDRLIVAQAISEQLVLVTADSRLAAYNVEILPGRRARASDD